MTQGQEQAAEGGVVVGGPDESEGKVFNVSKQHRLT